MPPSAATAESANTSDPTTPVPHPVPYPVPQAARTVAAGNDSRWRRWPGSLRGAFARVQLWARSLGPYVAIELLLPGGTIIALALYAYRRLRAGRGGAAPAVAAAAAKERRPSLRCVAPCGQG